MAYIKQLEDNEKNAIYPVTSAKAVYMKNGVDTLARVLEDSEDFDTTIKFSEKSIEQTLASGSKVVTEFKDSRVVETTTDEKGTIVKTKTTTFNPDGSIRIEVR